MATKKKSARSARSPKEIVARLREASKSGPTAQSPPKVAPSAQAPSGDEKIEWSMELFFQLMAIDIAKELDLPLFLTDFSVFEARKNIRTDFTPWFIPDLAFLCRQLFDFKCPAKPNNADSGRCLHESLKRAYPDDCEQIKRRLTDPILRGKKDQTKWFSMIRSWAIRLDCMNWRLNHGKEISTENCRHRILESICTGKFTPADTTSTNAVMLASFAAPILIKNKIQAPKAIFRSDELKKATMKESENGLELQKLIRRSLALINAPEVRPDLSALRESVKSMTQRKLFQKASHSRGRSTSRPCNMTPLQIVEAAALQHAFSYPLEAQIGVCHLRYSNELLDLRKMGFKNKDAAGRKKAKEYERTAANAMRDLP